MKKLLALMLAAVDGGGQGCKVIYNFGKDVKT